MNNFIRNIINHFFIKCSNIRGTRAYLQFYKNVIKENPQLGMYAGVGEDLWLDRWKKYDRNISPLSYRIFSRYIGDDIDIMPLEICVNIVEKILTPSNMSKYYSDKNMLGRIFPSINMPLNYIRNINGCFYDNKYCSIDESTIDQLIQSLNVDKVIVKPALDCSGHGVRCFRKFEGRFYDKLKNELSSSFLDAHYGKNYIIQEYISQSKVTSQFNLSSVNTIRIATYRDINGIVHPLNAGLRIGANGSEVDNAHAGGMFCGIDKNGNIGNFFCDSRGHRQSCFNGIDLSNHNYRIDNFEEIKQFAVSVSQNVYHHNLVALDIALQQDDKPILIEINVFGFGGWFFQFTSGSIFGKYTDEVMSYCCNHIKDVVPKFYLGDSQ